MEIVTIKTWRALLNFQGLTGHWQLGINDIFKCLCIDFKSFIILPQSDHVALELQCSWMEQKLLHGEIPLRSCPRQSYSRAANSLIVQRQCDSQFRNSALFPLTWRYLLVIGIQKQVTCGPTFTLWRNDLVTEDFRWDEDQSYYFNPQKS